MDPLGSALGDLIVLALQRVGRGLQAAALGTEASRRLRSCAEKAIRSAVVGASSVALDDELVEHFVALLSLDDPKAVEALVLSLSASGQGPTITQQWEEAFRLAEASALDYKYAPDLDRKLLASGFAAFFWEELHAEAMRPESPLFPVIVGLDFKDLRTRLHGHTAGQQINAVWRADCSSQDDEIRTYIEEMADCVGDTVQGYHVLEVLGRGGSGWVFRARHCDLGHDVALKLLYPIDWQNPLVDQLVERGFRAMGSLNHPNILTPRELGRTMCRGREVLYMVMLVVEGYSLEEWSFAHQLRAAGTMTVRPECITREELADRYRPADPGTARRQKTLPSWRSAESFTDILARRLAAAEHLALAVTAAHETIYTDRFGQETRGVLHGDLKPDNVLLDEDEHLYLSDFQLVDFVQLQSRNYKYWPPESQWTWVFGTPNYCAPEQERLGVMSVGTDIYGLGVTLCCLFRPHRHPVPLISVQEVVDGKALPTALTRLLRAMVSAAPERRPPHARTVYEELRRIRTTLPPS